MQLVPEKLREPLSNFKFNPRLKFSFYDKESLLTFFLTFRLKCYLLLLVSPIGLGAPAYVAQLSFGTDSLGYSIGLFVISLILLLPWTLVPILFLFTTFQSKTWLRKLSWAYVGLLVTTFIYWLTIF
ncbi:hypothetical protein [Ferdinandcohnia sp. Marseille-Q9671]